MTNKNPNLHQTIINNKPMKNKTRHFLLFLSCILLTALGFTILNADSTTTIGLDINTGNITSTGTITSQDLTIQKSDDTTLTIYSNTDDPTENDKLLIIQKGTTPLELFSVDEDGDVVIGNDLAITGNVTLGTWQGSVVGTQYGGTGSDWSTITQGNLPYFSGTGTLSNLAPGTTGQFLSQGSDGNPVWDNVARTATFVVAASDSLNKEQADYVCSGVDDQDIIQSIIADDIEIVFMAGQYNLSAELTITNIENLIMRGMGTATVFTDSTYLVNIINIADSKNVVIDSIKLHKVHGSGASEHGTIFNLESSEEITISNCWICGTQLTLSPWDATPTWGIRSQYSKGLVYHNNYVTGTDYEGLSFWQGTTGSIMSENIIDGCGFGLVTERSGNYGNIITGNTVRDSRLSGQPDILIRACHNNLISDNTVTDRNDTNAFGYAIQIDGGAHHNLIADNMVKGGKGMIIKEYSQDNTIQGNTFTNVAEEGILLSYSKNNNLVDNKIYFAAGSGIYLLESHYTYIDGNIIEFCGTTNSAGIYVLKSRQCEFLNNKFVGTANIAMCFNAAAGYSVADSVIRGNTIYDPFGEVANTINADASAANASVSVANIDTLHLGQFIRIEAGASQDDVRITNINHELSGSVTLTIDPALSNDHASGVAITGIAKQTRGFRIEGAGTISPVYIQHNHIRNATAYVISGATNAVFRNNIGYTTENSGSASVSNGDTIAHGLASTPTYINLTTSNANHIASATSIGSANITIGLINHDGTLITDDETVYWEAEVR